MSINYCYLKDMHTVIYLLDRQIDSDSKKCTINLNNLNHEKKYL